MKEKELENCTFSPSILRYNKEQSTISPERQRLNKLAKFEFGKNKSIWRKEFNIEDGQPKNPRFEVVIYYNIDLNIIYYIFLFSLN